MKFFTRQWANGELSDEEAATIPGAYHAHLAALLQEMPATLRALARGVNIHDGRLRHVVLDQTRNNLTISLRCGDLQVGYFDLDIVYHDVALDDVAFAALREAAQDPKTEALYDEIDISADNTWTHRILFWPNHEVVVRFRRLAMNLEPRPDREFRRPVEVFVEIRRQAV